MPHLLTFGLEVFRLRRKIQNFFITEAQARPIQHIRATACLINKNDLLELTKYERAFSNGTIGATSELTSSLITRARPG